jgi:CheY-like chemotaxis protein
MLEPYHFERTAAPLILIAEEDANLRSHIRQLLAINGYRVIEVADGGACLAAVARWQPDLIILDTLLPIIDGWTCCWELRTEAHS